MWDIIKAVITDANFIGAIISSLAFIFLGYLLRSKNIISADGKKAISAIVLKIALPAMAISCFMVDLDYEVLMCYRKNETPQQVLEEVFNQACELERAIKIFSKNVLDK